jgi:diguanylate cyclase (GGDEF)-like protein
MALADPDPCPQRPERTDIAVCALLLVLITLLRLAVSNPIEAVGFLYVIPISLLASERGLRGGIAAAAGAMLCTYGWAVLQDVPLGLVGYSARTATFLGVGVFVGLQARERMKLQREREDLLAELQATATHDPLTGLPNRGAWDDRLERELRRAAATHEALSALAIDLDGLKRINDTHGPQEGDRLLQRCAHAWNGVLRQGDYLARLGGDEFLVLLPGSAEAEAEHVARRILGAVPFNQTCSIGIATWDGAEAAFELVQRADQAMYEAKAAGGGRAQSLPRSIRDGPT